MSTIIEHADKWVQTRTQGIFAIPPSFGSGGAAKVGVDITPLDVTITPVKAGNKIELSFIMFGAGHQPSIESGFILKRNGVNLGNTSDFSNNYYAINGISLDTGHISSDVPEVNIVTLTDNISLDIESTYTLAVRHTSSNVSSVVNFYLNRSRATPGDRAETGVSTTIITEYDL